MLCPGAAQGGQRRFSGAAQALLFSGEHLTGVTAYHFVPHLVLQRRPRLRGSSASPRAGALCPQGSSASPTGQWTPVTVPRRLDPLLGS